ncbi:hypothetical protein LS72_005750 [Helicobacter apodemus]|uniref:Uncharacterized protein n=1 Tax=Helicobacter apodemus TaxID=135569 RepID=A0A4U8UFV4_9HELI|nr:hypothetical protein [Helicobacter apodemus]TLE15738.1 hypothetical protein LS72_005750 [Helicobacter apodemus]
MKTTEGAWVPFAVRIGIGAFYGGAHNIAYQIGKNQGWSWRSFRRGVYAGAVGYKYLKPIQIFAKSALAPATMGGSLVAGRVMTKYVQPRLESLKSQYPQYFRR